MKLRAVALGVAICFPLANAYTGDLTYYTPGQGSCGITNKNGDAIVAISVLLINNCQNPNTNPVCNKQISIHNPTTGTNTTATITDTCKACAISDIDVPPALFSIIAPTGNGRVHGIEWTPVGDWTFSGGASESAPAQSSASPTAQPSLVDIAPIPSAAVPTLAVQEKVAAVAPLAAAAAPSESSSPSAALSVPAAAPSAASPSAAQQPPSAPTSSTTSCTTAGQTVCSADGTQVGTCTTELTVQLGPVAAGTKCAGGYLVMANSRLRSRRG